MSKNQLRSLFGRPISFSICRSVHTRMISAWRKRLFRFGLSVIKNNGNDYLDNGYTKQTLCFCLCLCLWVFEWLTMWQTNNITVDLFNTPKKPRRDYRYALCTPTIQYHLNRFWKVWTGLFIRWCISVVCDVAGWLAAFLCIVCFQCHKQKINPI